MFLPTVDKIVKLYLLLSILYYSTVILYNFV